MNKQSGPFESLPKQKQQRIQLIKAIQKYMNKLQKVQDQNTSEKIQLLKLRIKLIDACSQLSLTRLTHLEEIFKHYCTHIFKTGKHMTFERLQYQKTHLTMERFFLFMKDFKLNTIEVNGVAKQLVDKNTIILMFKKISSNIRDLSFEEFITILEKLAVIHYDEKLGYDDKIAKLQQNKKKKREDYEKKKQLKLKKSVKKQIFQQDDKQSQRGQQGGEGVDVEKQKQQEQKKQENDDLVKQMMNNNQLQDPNEQVQNAINETKKGQIDVQWENQNQNQQKESFNLINDEVLEVLTKQEKIQLYYQLIHVDSVQDYRQKLCELDLAIFKNYSKTSHSSKPRKQNSLNNPPAKEKKQSISVQMDKSMRDLETSQRLMALKEKLNQKKVKQKNSPNLKAKKDQAIIKAEQQRKRRRQQTKQKTQQAKKNKQYSDQAEQKKLDAKRKPFFVDKNQIQFNEKQVNWNVMKISLEQLKIKQFQPQKYYHAEDDDRIFLEQYGNDYIGKGKMSGRNSIAIVQGVKKRVNEVQKVQYNNEKNLDRISKKIGMHQPVRKKF